MAYNYIMKVYRLQNHNSTGPFRTGDEALGVITDTLQLFYGEFKNHPTPEQDFGLRPFDIPFCQKYGCDSLEQLKHWFVIDETNYRKTLGSFNYYLMPDNLRDLTLDEFNSKVLDGFERAGFSLVCLDIPDEFVQYGNSLTQVMYDCTEVLSMTTLSLTNLFQGTI